MNFGYNPREFQIQRLFFPTRVLVVKVLCLIFSKQDFDLALGVQHKCERTEEKHTGSEVNCFKTPLDLQHVS